MDAPPGKGRPQADLRSPCPGAEPGGDRRARTSLGVAEPFEHLPDPLITQPILSTAIQARERSTCHDHPPTPGRSEA